MEGGVDTGGSVVVGSTSRRNWCEGKVRLFKNIRLLRERLVVYADDPQVFLKAQYANAEACKKFLFIRY